MELKDLNENLGLFNLNHEMVPSLPGLMGWAHNPLRSIATASSSQSCNSYTNLEPQMRMSYTLAVHSSFESTLV